MENTLDAGARALVEMDSRFEIITDYIQKKPVLTVLNNANHKKSV